MKSCPYCAEEIQDAAVRCRWCGSDLSAAGSPTPGATAGAPAAPTFTQTGRRYLLGYGADYYGLWDQQTPGPPLHRFPADDAGWDQAWRQYCRSEAEELPAPRRPIIGQPIPGSLADVAAEVAARGRRLIAALGSSPSPAVPPSGNPPIPSPIEETQAQPPEEPTPADEGPPPPPPTPEAPSAHERICPACSRANPEEHRFCEACGAPL